MMDARWSTCALCPRLCRTSCPVATGGGREAAVPTFIAQTLGEWEQGRATEAEARYVATLCTDCGACKDRCHEDRPLPEALAEVRSTLLDAPGLEPLQPIEGEAEWVAVEVDERPMAEALARVLGVEVSRWPTGDRLGVAAVEHDVFRRRARRLDHHCKGRRLVVCDGGVARVLDAANISFEWLHQAVPDLEIDHGSCRSGGSEPLACCGGAGPLRAFHPEDARRVGRMWLDRSKGWTIADARCRSHLRDCGGHEVRDALDRLIERVRLT